MNGQSTLDLPGLDAGAIRRLLAKFPLATVENLVERLVLDAGRDDAQ